MKMRFGWGLLLAGALVSGCSGDSDNQPAEPVVDEGATVAPQLRVAVLPDTQGGGFNTSTEPMRALLEFYRAEGVDVVLVVGDLSENGTPAEYAQWRGVAEDFKDDFVMLPLQGNHDIKGADQDWFDNVIDLIPANAEHMPGHEYRNYAWVRDNVLIISISYGRMPFAYEFVRDTIAKHRDQVDHVIVATHNTMAGGRYGYIREMAVEAYDSSVADQQFLQVHDDYRQLFADNDVIYIAGHEHAYLRSVINGYIGGRYTEIVAGNASYKGYDSRFGESEQIQNVVMAKYNDPGATGTTDVNATILEFQGSKVDYRSYFESHTITRNEDGMKELASPDWKLIDRFARTTDRCEKIVFPSSIPANNQLNMTHDKRYRTSTCESPNGFQARLIDGDNNIFNRYESRTRTTSVTPGVSTAANNTALAARYYRWLHVTHNSWSPNLNNNQRVQLINPGTASEAVQIRETTIDLKKHVTLSWLPADEQVLSDRLIVSGIQGQDGTYSSARGVAKSIETDLGLPGSRGDGSENPKQPVLLPAGRVNQNWVLDDDERGDDYVLQFNVPAGLALSEVTLGRWDSAQQRWVAVVANDCLSSLSYDSTYLTALPADVDAACPQAVGQVSTGGTPHLWARLDTDGVFALIPRN